MILAHGRATTRRRRLHPGRGAAGDGRARRGAHRRRAASARSASARASIGVNARDLDTLEVDRGRQLELRAPRCPARSCGWPSRASARAPTRGGPRRRRRRSARGHGADAPARAARRARAGCRDDARQDLRPDPAREDVEAAVAAGADLVGFILVARHAALRRPPTAPARCAARVPAACGTSACSWTRPERVDSPRSSPRGLDLRADYARPADFRDTIVGQPRRAAGATCPDDGAACCSTCPTGRGPTRGAARRTGSGPARRAPAACCSRAASTPATSPRPSQSPGPGRSTPRAASSRRPASRITTAWRRFVPPPRRRRVTHAPCPDERGRFGRFGGRFVPETVMAALDELAAGYATAPADPAFAAERRAPRARLRRPADAALPGRAAGRGRRRPHLAQARGPEPHRRAQDQQRRRPGAARAAARQAPDRGRDRRRPARRRRRDRVRPLRPRLPRLHGRGGHPPPAAQRRAHAPARRRGACRSAPARARSRTR